MKITLLANQDLASNIALNKLLAALPQHDYSILLSAKVGSSQAKAAALNELAFFEQTLFNQIFFPALTGHLEQPSEKLRSFEHLQSSRVSVQRIQPADKQALFDQIYKTSPELIISIRFGYILTPPIIALPKYGVLNLHSGILPEYRGVMATFWAMLNGEPEIGTSLHFIEDAGIDTGGLIKIDKRPMDRGQSYLGNLLSLYDQGVASLSETVILVEQQRPIETRVQTGNPNYFSFPTDADIRLFIERGFSLVNVDEIAPLAQQYL